MTQDLTQGELVVNLTVNLTVSVYKASVFAIDGHRSVIHGWTTSGIQWLTINHYNNQMSTTKPGHPDYNLGRLQTSRRKLSVRLRSLSKAASPQLRTRVTYFRPVTQNWVKLSCHSRHYPLILKTFLKANIFVLTYLSITVIDRTA